MCYQTCTSHSVYMYLVLTLTLNSEFSIDDIINNNLKKTRNGNMLIVCYYK